MNKFLPIFNGDLILLLGPRWLQGAVPLGQLCSAHNMFSFSYITLLRCMSQLFLSEPVFLFSKHVYGLKRHISNYSVNHDVILCWANKKKWHLLINICE